MIKPKSSQTKQHKQKSCTLIHYLTHPYSSAARHRTSLRERHKLETLVTQGHPVFILAPAFRLSSLYSICMCLYGAGHWREVKGCICLAVLGFMLTPLLNPPAHSMRESGLTLQFGEGRHPLLPRCLERRTWGTRWRMGLRREEACVVGLF